MKPCFDKTDKKPNQTVTNEWRMFSLKLYKRLFFTVCRQRPYHVETTGSRPITEVKQRRARLVLGWVTAWEHRVLLATFFYYFFYIYFLTSVFILYLDFIV